MSNMYMPGAAAIISLILLIVYCSKEKIRLKENNIYLGMLICIMLDSLFVTTIYFLSDKSPLLVLIFNRCDYMMLVIWSGCLFLYAHMVIHKTDEAVGIIRYRIFRRIMVGFVLVECVLIWVLHIEGIVEEGVVVLIEGPVIYFTLSCCALHILFSLLVIICNIRKVTRKIIPVFICLAMAALIALTYYLDSSISGVSMGLAIVNLTMYFTIENPDVQMLEKVNIAKEQALRANLAKTDFLSSMSHEIRTPLNAIVSFAECIQHDDTLEMAKMDAKDIMTASNNLLEIVNGILDISKIEAERVEVIDKEYDLIELSENLSRLIRARIGEKPIELRIDFSEDIPGLLYGDETKMRQIMTNLLTNAVKYTDSGYVDFVIKCDNEADMANLKIIVKDTGHGIKDDVIAVIFDKFQRLEEDKNTNIEGTGLGLAITKKYVEMLGGSIEVQSVYGEGSTFIFKVSQKIHSLERKITETIIETREDYSGNSTLVVDDTEMNLMVARRILGLYKIDVDTASSGEECIEKCRTNAYDMIFLDEMMPKLSGIETLNILKENPDFAIPVIACTADAIDGMREKYIEGGFNDYLSKPIVKLELLRILKEYL